MIFGKLEYHFIWMGLDYPIRLTHVKLQEKLVPKCDRKSGQDLKERTLALLVE